MLSDYIQLIWINRQLNLKTPLEKCPVGLDQNKSTDLKLAPNLIALAYQSRPNGPVIKEKHNEYKNLLDKYNEEDV